MKEIIIEITKNVKKELKLLKKYINSYQCYKLQNNRDLATHYNSVIHHSIQIIDTLLHIYVDTVKKHLSETEDPSVKALDELLYSDVVDKYNKIVAVYHHDK